MFRTISKLNTAPIIHITENAWNKLKSIQQNSYFMFYAEGGGCNGFNYRLSLIKNSHGEKLLKKKLPPSIIRKNNETTVVIDPLSEMYLIGTTIDYQFENMEKGIYDSKFIFTPDKNLATSCGCGVSFSPR